MDFRNDRSRDVSIVHRDRGEGPIEVNSQSPALVGPSPLSIHEASYAVAGKHFGMPIAIVTIVPGQWFQARCIGPGTSLEDSPAPIFAACEARCSEAKALMPPPGESDLDAGPWFAEVRARVCELLAGYEGERIAGFAPEGEELSSDVELANLYAVVILRALGNRRLS